MPGTLVGASVTKQTNKQKKAEPISCLQETQSH